MKKQLLSFFIFLSATFAKAQTDTLFYFAAPEVTEGLGAWDRPIVLRITSYSKPASVEISLPANQSVLDTIINISADSLYSFDLTTWIDSIENKPANTILNNGLKIQSSNPISIYYEVVSAACQCNPEIFVLKGQNALGFDFWIPSQNLADYAGYSPVTNSSFDIVAARNNTIVTITPSKNIVGHGADTTFTIILNEGQTYSAMASNGLAADHLNGSRVLSNKQIAITIKDDIMQSAVYGSCSDLGGDQIVPFPVLGTEYIAINGGQLATIGDQVFILATHDTTYISQDGNVVDTINAGETLQLDVGDSASFIQTSYPASILQISGYGCELGIDILPQINCTGSDSIALARSTYEDFFVNLLVPNGGQNYFLVNGISGIIDSSIFKNVPGTAGSWFSGQASLNTNVLPVNGSVLISNSFTPFHLSVIHGGSTTGTRYGYFSDFACPSPQGIIEVSPKMGILIYPNPTKNELNIGFSTEIKDASIDIFNTIGERVKSIKSFTGKAITYNISTLQNGMFFIKISVKEDTVVQKFIKQ